MRHMNKAPIREELPLASTEPLPYLAVYRSFLPKKTLVPIGFLMVSTVGLVVSHNLFVALFFLMELSSIAAILVIALKTSKKKRETWSFLAEQHKEFTEVVSERYGVTLTETILYQLAQGGETLLPDNNGQLTRIMMESDPATQTTKLVESGKV